MEGKSLQQQIDWEIIFNAVDDPIFVMNNENIIIQANLAFAKMLKMELDEIIGKRCYELLHNMHDPWPGCPFEKSKKDKKTNVEEVNDPNIGVPLLITTSPIFNETGEIIGVVRVSKNIEHLKKIENELKNKIEALERFQRITVGRELKMKELKAKIAELETHVGSRWREEH